MDTTKLLTKKNIINLQITNTTPSDLTPMLNEDGSAIQPYAEAPGRAAAGPRRDPFGGESTGGGDGEGPLEPGTPIGSVLVLLAMGYAALTYLRKRKNLVTE